MADPADVELVAQATEQHHLVVGEHDADGNCPCCCGNWHEGGDETWDEHMATVALAALAERLLPAGGEERTEWRAEWRKADDFLDVSISYRERAHAEEHLNADPGGRLVSRRVWVGPWTGAAR